MNRPKGVDNSDSDNGSNVDDDDNQGLVDFQDDQHDNDQPTASFKTKHPRRRARTSEDCGDDDNGDEPDESFKSPPSAKKARFETTNEEAYWTEYRRLEMALAAANEDFEAADRSRAGALQEKTRLFAIKCGFNMICWKLRHNRPLESDTTSFENEEYTFPQGYANRLGHVLRQNTQLTVLTLFPRKLLPEHCGFDTSRALVHVKPLLDFVQSSQSLRRVQILNAYGVRSAHNLFGRTPMETLHALLESIVAAIAANASIENVHYECYESSSVFALMSKSKSIKVLNVDLRLLRDLDAVEQPSMVPGLENANVATEMTQHVCCAKLEHLTVQNIDDKPNMAVMIVENLPNWAPALNDLTLRGSFFQCPTFVMTLQFWQSLATTVLPMLQSLHLADFELDEESTMLILNGLCGGSVEMSGRHFTVALTKLAMSNCIMDQAATEALVNWMNTPTNNNNGSKTAGGTTFNTRRRNCCSSLRELHVERVTDETFGDPEAVAPTIASMLLLQTSTNNAVSRNGNNGDDLVSTIGSNIRTLSLGRFRSAPRRSSTSHVDVLLQLSRSKERVQLRVLRLDDTNVRECRRLRQILPNLPSIRELHMGRLSNHVGCLPIVLAMLRENVHLGMFSCNDEATVFTARQLRLATAFQERNQFFGRHFGTKSRAADVSFDGKTDAATTSTDNETDERITAMSSSRQRLDASLYPPLFQLAEPVLDTQQWHIPFRGLSMLGDSIGFATSDES